MSFFTHEDKVNPKSLSSIDIHDNVAIIYDSQQNKVQVLSELCRIGLERNEQCLIATHGWKDIDTQLRLAGINIDAAMASGALIVKDIAEIVPKHEDLDPIETIAMLKKMIHEAIDHGFSGLRIFNSTYLPTRHHNVQVHLEFISKMAQLISDNEVVRISFYDLNRQDPEVIINAILSHPTIVLRGIVCNNFYYVPPRQLLTPESGSIEMYRLLDGLIDVHHNQITLKESHDELEIANSNLREEINKRKMVEWALLISELRYRNTLDSLNEPVIVIDRDYRVIVTNKAMELMGEKFGVNCRCVGQPFTEAFPRISKEELDEYDWVFKNGETIVTQRFYDPNGIMVFAEISKVPMMEGDSVVNVTTIILKLDKKE
jgi:PAS domain-containing protein